MISKFPDGFKTVQIFQLTANFPDYFKIVRIFRKDIHYDFFGNVVRGEIALFRLVVRNGSRTSSGKFLRVESCYPENFGFLRL